VTCAVVQSPSGAKLACAWPSDEDLGRVDEPSVKTVSEDRREVSCRREVSGRRCCAGVERECRKGERKG
jgi:hypothetical protein